MKIHEYQGKTLLKQYNVPIQDGYVVENLSHLESTIESVRKDFSSDAVVVKAQIHAGGRGKGGGVKYSPTPESALENATNILYGATPDKPKIVRRAIPADLYTLQTSKWGFQKNS